MTPAACSSSSGSGSGSGSGKTDTTLLIDNADTTVKSANADGAINPGEMTSFNHDARGAVADWMHRAIGGIAPLAPGYARVRIAPMPGGELAWAKAALETRHGTIATDWALDGEGSFRLRVNVPQDVEAEVHLPDGTQLSVGSRPHEFRCGADRGGVSVAGAEGGSHA